MLLLRHKKWITIDTILMTLICLDLSLPPFTWEAVEKSLRTREHQLRVKFISVLYHWYNVTAA